MSEKPPKERAPAPKNRVSAYKGTKKADFFPPLVTLPDQVSEKSYRAGTNARKEALLDSKEIVAIGIDPGFTGAIVVATKNKILAMLDLERALPLAPHHAKNQGSVPLGSSEYKPVLLSHSKQTVDDTIRQDSFAKPLFELADHYESIQGKKQNIDGSYLDPGIIFEFLKPYSSLGFDPVKPDVIVIEDVTAMTGMESASSSFKFGQTKGLLTGICYALFPHTPTRYLKPAVWKAALGLSSNKDESLEKARNLFVDQKDILFSRKKDNNRAEAALLAACGLSLIRAKRLIGEKDIMAYRKEPGDRAIDEPEANKKFKNIVRVAKYEKKS